MIPMIDLHAQYQQLKKEIDQGVMNVLESCQYVLGPQLKAFETEISKYLGVKHAIGLASGTDALHLALLAVDIQAGDEVITTPFSFIAACEAICYIGAKPVFVDVDPYTYNINIAQLEAAITPKTRAIIPVHLYGNPVDMVAVNNLAQKYQLRVIEDCAQSLGARLHGQHTGTLGEIGCFSFYPSKTLGAYGDGGMVTTNSDVLADKMLKLRNHGGQVRYEHEIIGFNSRLDEIQAVILKIKLKYLDEFNAKRRAIAALYNELLANSEVTLPQETVNYTHVYHQYTLLSQQRDIIMQSLTQEKIASSIHYPTAIHRQPVFAKEYAHHSYPVSERLARECLSLPIYPEMTTDQVMQVVNVIKETLRKNK